MSYKSEFRTYIDSLLVSIKTLNNSKTQYSKSEKSNYCRTLEFISPKPKMKFGIKKIVI